MGFAMTDCQFYRMDFPIDTFRVNLWLDSIFFPDLGYRSNCKKKSHISSLLISPMVTTSQLGPTVSCQRYALNSTWQQGLHVKRILCTYVCLWFVNKIALEQFVRSWFLLSKLSWNHSWGKASFHIEKQASPNCLRRCVLSHFLSSLRFMKHKYECLR